MILRPTSSEDLAKLVLEAYARSEKVSGWELSALGRLLEHKPEDMTATVEAGMTLAAFQEELAKRGQWLPIDAPNAERLSIGDLLAFNPSGPRRFGYGTVRDYLLGLTAVLADGRIISSGGKVVKNVAGYDLGRLFIGSRGSLGLIVEATFKLRPLPEAEKFVCANCPSLADAERLVGTVLNSELTPTVFDLQNVLETNSHRDGSVSLVLGFSGSRELVDWQLLKAREIGFSEPSSLDYEKEFWKEPESIQKRSVLPSRTIEMLRTLGNATFVARAGNGVIYVRGAFAPSQRESSSRLAARLKDEFDPKRILPELPL